MRVLWFVGMLLPISLPAGPYIPATGISEAMRPGDAQASSHVVGPPGIFAWVVRPRAYLHGSVASGRGLGVPAPRIRVRLPEAPLLNVVMGMRALPSDDPALVGLKDRPLTGGISARLGARTILLEQAQATAIEARPPVLSADLQTNNGRWVFLRWSGTRPGPFGMAASGFIDLLPSVHSDGTVTLLISTKGLWTRPGASDAAGTTAWAAPPGLLSGQALVILPPAAGLALEVRVLDIRPTVAAAPQGK